MVYRTRRGKRKRWAWAVQLFFAVPGSLFFLMQWLTLNSRTVSRTSEASIADKQEVLSTIERRQKDLSDVLPKSSNVEEISSIPESFPKWLQDYIFWHASRKQQMSPNNWDANGNLYLVMTCLRDSYACGGLSDRLQHIPTIVHMAARTNRVLLIYWEAPAALEEFLLPRPTSIPGLPVGLDWRAPDWMIPLLFHSSKSNNRGCTFVQKIRSIAEENPKAINNPALCTRSTMHRHGQGLYDEWRQGDEPTFLEIYHDIWRFLFAPSPPIAAVLKEQMERMHLEPGKYVMTHVRALYGVHSRDETFIRDMTQNAVQCGLQLVSQLQAKTSAVRIFFASDSSVAARTALEYGNGTVVSATSPDAKPPLHLDRANSTDPSDYYNIFVDLLLLGNSRCATFNIGGFGRWGALIAYPFYEHTIINKAKEFKSDNGVHSPCWIEHHKHDCTNEATT